MPSRVQAFYCYFIIHPNHSDLVCIFVSKTSMLWKRYLLERDALFVEQIILPIMALYEKSLFLILFYYSNA
jgi:hypothetical protein